ncbi:MAG: LysR family transcriptional regulator [Myxococcota bacterium]
MSLVQLESFVAVAEEEHVGRAARRLHLSQPPLTRRIQSLEDELGLELFERTPRGMRLRPAGQRLLPRAREILARVDALPALLRAPDDDAAQPSFGPPEHGVASPGDLR